MKNDEVLLPDIVKVGQYTYVLSDEALEYGDWYIDHQKYNYGWGSCVERCDHPTLHDFINNHGSDMFGGKWRSRKIIITDNPDINV